MFPLSALDQHVAVLGKTGSGKSYTTRGLVERLLDAGRRVCILDYTGVWYGLRSSANGARAGFPAIIFGGEHADVPLADGAGPAVAEIVAFGKQPTVIDLDGLSVGAQQRFVTAFLEELYRLNKAPLHLVIEEADEFAPQTGAPGAERMIGATCRIFQRGRKKGFRAIAVTQRPANIHKRVLAQCNSLIAMRLPAPQDQKAVADWIRGHGDDEKGKEVIASLAKLPRGTGWVWAPELDILSRVEFPSIKTFDSMKAPEEGDTDEPATWADIDLATVRERMSTALEEAKANDPKTLKAEIARLKAEMHEMNKNASADSAVDLDAIRRADAKGYERGLTVLRIALDAAIMDADRAIAEDVIELHGRTVRLEETIRAHLKNLAKAVPAVSLPAAASVPRSRTRETSPNASVSPKPAGQDKRGAGNGLDAAALKLLGAFERYPSSGLTWEEACVVAGMIPGNGYFYGGKKRLVEGSHVVEENGRWRVTKASAAARYITKREILSTWSKLKQPAPRMLEFLLKENERVSVNELASAIGAKPGNGYWYGGVAALRDANLIEDGKGSITLSPFVAEASP